MGIKCRTGQNADAHSGILASGYDHQIEAAKQKIQVGQILTVKEIFVGGWSSVVTVEEADGEFNTCLFEDVEVEQ